MKRADIVDKARELIGTRYRHQGRNPATGVDCVGLLVAVADSLGYPHTDMTVYRRVPQPEVLIGLMRDNLDEIPLEEATIGDVVLMTVGGRKPRHAAIIASESTLIHSLNKPGVNRVVEHPIKLWARGFVKAFRMRGVE